MADDPIHRPFRANEGLGRTASPGPASSTVNDPLAELARLIGQNDPFGEFGRDTERREVPPPASAASAAPVPGYPSPPAEDLYRAEASMPGYGLAPGDYDAYDHDPYEPNLAPLPPEDGDYYDDVPPRRRTGILVVAAVFALAVIGTAGAFGYRALFGSVPSGPPPVIKADASPSKIVPDSKKNPQAKLINDRVGGAADEKLVSREEQPIDLPDKPVGMLAQNPTSPAAAPAGSIQPPVPGSGVIAGTEPKTVHTITIRPDRPMVASAAATAVPNLPSPPEAARMPAAEPAPAAPEPARAPAPAAEPDPPARHTASTPHRAPPAGNAPLSLSPNAVAPVAPAAAAPPPARTAARSDPAAAGGYAVQISSRRNEADAEAAFRTLQTKFPGQLGGRQPLIRRVDLGEKGVYYRAMIGPFGSASEASRLCSDLKAAGGSCFVQRI
jgi:hypothetical protein